MPWFSRALAVAAIVAATVSGGWLRTTAANAQTYPSKPIRIVVGFPAGGGVDSVARIMGDELSRALGQPVLVENKPGAAGMLGAAEVAKADPDGHVLMVSPGGHPIFGAIFKQLSFDTVDSFSWISNVISVPFYIIAHDDSEFKSMADVVAKAKAAPGTVTFGSAGAGSTHHLMVELISLSTGAKFNHVPYRGDAPIVTDVLGKHIQFGPATPTGLAGLLEKGKLRALAVTTGKRWPSQPTIPTVAEALGIKDYDIGTWFGIGGPARMPKEIVDRLNGETRKAVATEGVRKRLELLGGVVAPSTPEELRGKVARELAMWTSIVDRVGIPKQ